jgi:predicted transcriptional regulator
VSKTNALAHAARERIVTHLRAEPGDHLRGVARALDLTAQNASYHLRQLEACGLASSVRVGPRRCYYATEGGRAARDRAEVNGLLAGGHRAAVLAAVLDAPGIHEAALARRIGVAHGSVSWSVRQLERDGLVARDARGNRACVFPTARASELRLGLRAPELAMDVPVFGTN